MIVIAPTCPVCGQAPVREPLGHGWDCPSCGMQGTLFYLPGQLRWTLTVPGPPVAMPRARTVTTRQGQRLTYVPHKVREYQDRILWAARQAQWPMPLAAKGQPLVVVACFYLPRPKYMSRLSKRDPTKLLGGYPRHAVPATARPDTDNLVKSVLDALQLGGYLVDDAAVVAVVPLKLYHALDDQPHTALAIGSLM